jgi:hypothetical protein
MVENVPIVIDPYNLNQPSRLDMGKIIPRDQTGIDFLLVSPDNDTSKRYEWNAKTKEVQNIQLPYKNLNTMDVTTSNISDFKFVSMSMLGYVSLRRQATTEYFQTLAGQRERVRYDFSGSQARLTNFVHYFCSLTKGARPRGGMLMNSIRTKLERVESMSVEDIKQSGGNGEKNQPQQKQGMTQGWK